MEIIIITYNKCNDITKLKVFGRSKARLSISFLWTQSTQVISSKLSFMENLMGFFVVPHLSIILDEFAII